MKNAHESGTPVIRPLFFDFPSDKHSYEIEDEYMFGPDILVAPVLYKHMRSRKVYLPTGTDWIDEESGKKYKGGEWIEYATPLDIIPVFSRKNATFHINLNN